MAKKHDENLTVIKEFQVRPTATMATNASRPFTACRALF